MSKNAAAFDSRLRKSDSNSAADTLSTNVVATRNVIARFTFGERSIEVTYPDHGAGCPQWLEPAIRSLCTRLGVEQGWDGYNAKPTDMNYVSILLHNLFPLMQAQSTPPVMTPLADGGVQAEWHRSKQALEIEVSAEGPPVFYYYNSNTGEETDGELSKNFLVIRDLISKF